MKYITPYLYKVTCATCGGLSTLPIDMLQTKILTNNSININFNEFKYMFAMCNIFAFQNIIYTNSNFIFNKSLRGIFAGFIITPSVVYFKMQQYYNRLNILPKYKYFIFLTFFREILFYSILYTLYASNLKYNKFLAPLIANSLAFPLKVLTVKYSYKTFNIKTNNIKYSALIEILKSAIGDSIALFLIYKN